MFLRFYLKGNIVNRIVALSILEIALAVPFGGSALAQSNVNPWADGGYAGVPLPEVDGAVHGNHWRAWQRARLIPWRRLHCRAADPDQQHPVHRGAGCAGGGGLECRADRLRLPNHLLPDRRACGPGAALGDRQGEASHVAVPLLAEIPQMASPNRR